MESINTFQQVVAPLGVYGITVFILLMGIIALGKYIADRDKRDREDQAKREINRDMREERWAKVVENNTLSNEALIQRFDDFVRNNKRK